MVSVCFGLSVEKLVMCPISICAIEPPRRPWQVLTGKEAGGLQSEIIAAQIEMLNCLEQNGRHKFMWIHFRHCKGTSGKNAAPRNRDVSDRVQSQGSGGVESSVRAERS